MPRLSDGFRRPRTTYETIRPAVLKTSKFKAVSKKAGSVWFHPSLCQHCGSSRPARHTWQLLSRAQGTACGKRGRSSLRRAWEGLGVWWRWKGHAAQFYTTSSNVLSEMSANGLIFRETSSSKSSPKVQFEQEICAKCATLDKILVHIQTLDLGKGPLEKVLSFPNLKFSLDETNLHRWRCPNRAVQLTGLEQIPTTL
jgi:hypothetical protein